MGILGFLKKENAGKATELPPLPDMSSLPPLPEMPNEPAPEVPSPPMDEQELNWDAAESEDTTPLFPDMPEDQEETQAKPTKKDEVPDKVPELGDLPEPPSFRLQQQQQEIREIKPLNVQFKPLPLPETRQGGIPNAVPQLEGFAPSRFIPPEQPHLKRHRNAQGPLFVRMDEYKTILENIENMRNEFKENENIYVSLNDCKNEQDKAFERFHNALEDIQRKLLYMDKTFFDTE